MTVEIGLEWGRLHAGIRGRKTAADIDDVDRHRGLDDRIADPAHGVAVGRRAHRLAADVEADAERIGRLARGHQQRLHLMGLGAELGGEAELGMVRADPQADQQVEVGCGDTVGGGRATILSSSSSVSRLKVFTPWVK